MKYFTKILSVFLCAAEIRVLAELNDATLPLTSQNCKNALSKFNESNTGKSLEKCFGILEKGKIDDLCHECTSIVFPSDVKNECKTKEDDLYMVAFKSAFDDYNEKMKKLCKDQPKKTDTKVSTTTSKVPEATKVPTNSTVTTTITKVSTQVSITTPPASKTTPATQGTQAPVQGAQNSTQSAQAPVQGAQDPQAQTPINNPIVSDNQQLETVPNELDSSASKLAYSVVAAFALAAFNLLL